MWLPVETSNEVDEQFQKLLEHVEIRTDEASAVFLKIPILDAFSNFHIIRN